MYWHPNERKRGAIPARFVTTSLVIKCAGIAARFVTLVAKRAVVTKRSATDSGFKECGRQFLNIFLTPIINAHILYCDTYHFASDHLILHIASLFWAAPLLHTQLLLVVVMLDLQNARGTGGNRTQRGRGKGNYTNDNIVTTRIILHQQRCKPSSIDCWGAKSQGNNLLTNTTPSFFPFTLAFIAYTVHFSSFFLFLPSTSLWGV